MQDVFVFLRVGSGLVAAGYFQHTNAFIRGLTLTNPDSVFGLGWGLGFADQGVFACFAIGVQMELALGLSRTVQVSTAQFDLGAALQFFLAVQFFSPVELVVGTQDAFNYLGASPARFVVSHQGDHAQALLQLLDAGQSMQGLSLDWSTWISQGQLIRRLANNLTSRHLYSLRSIMSTSLLSSKFYRLFERKPGTNADPKAIVTLGDKEYVKFQYEPIYVNEDVILYFMIQSNTDKEFEYVRIEISIVNTITRATINSVKEVTKTLKKDNPHYMPFSFKVSEEGDYMIRTHTVYKEKQFISSAQSVAPEKQESATMKLQINRVFGIKEKVFYIEKQKLLTYPLFVQYSVENLTDKPRNFKAEFVSDKFFVEYMDGKQSYQMLDKETENIVVKLKPKDLSTIYKTTRLGTFRVLWHKDGKQQKVLNVKFDQIVMIRCSTVTKAITKKDVHTVKIRIQKKLDQDFPSIDLYLKEGKDQHCNIKILNLSKNKISLMQSSFEQIELSVVGLASGCHLLKGFRLRTPNNQDIPYENELAIMVLNETEEKQEKKVFQDTGKFDVFDMQDI